MLEHEHQNWLKPFKLTKTPTVIKTELNSEKSLEKESV